MKPRLGAPGLGPSRMGPPCWVLQAGDIPDMGWCPYPPFGSLFHLTVKATSNDADFLRALEKQYHLTVRLLTSWYLNTNFSDFATLKILSLNLNFLIHGFHQYHFVYPYTKYAIKDYNSLLPI